MNRAIVFIITLATVLATALASMALYKVVKLEAAVSHLQSTINQNSNLSENIHAYENSGDVLLARANQLIAEYSDLTQKLLQIHERLATLDSEPGQEYLEVRERALEEIEQEIEQEVAQSAEALANRARHQEQINRRMEMMDVELHSVYLNMESLYGQHFRALGISGARYDDIMEALTLSQFDVRNMRLSLDSGEISEEEFNAIIEGNTMLDVLRSSLDDDELRTLVELRNNQRAVAEARNAYASMYTFTPNMTIESRSLASDAYADITAQRPMTDTPTDARNAVAERYEYMRSVALPALRSEMQPVFDAAEMRELEQFIEYESARLERYIRSMQAQ